VNDDDDKPVTVPTWVVALALQDHHSNCSYCSNGRADICRDDEYTGELERALARAACT